MIDIHVTDPAREGSSCSGCGIYHETIRAEVPVALRSRPFVTRLTTIAVGGPAGGTLLRYCDGCLNLLFRQLLELVMSLA